MHKILPFSTFPTHPNPVSQVWFLRNSVCTMAAKICSRLWTQPLLYYLITQVPPKSLLSFSSPVYLTKYGGEVLRQSFCMTPLLMDRFCSSSLTSVISRLGKWTRDGLNCAVYAVLSSPVTYGLWLGDCWGRLPRIHLCGRVKSLLGKKRYLMRPGVWSDPYPSVGVG